MIHTGIVQYLSEIDTNIFLSFNGIHSPFWDYFMSSFTGKFIWIPMYATILYILLKNFHWKVVMCYVAAIALTITFADQMCSSIIRPVVARQRPANPESIFAGATAPLMLRKMTLRALSSCFTSSARPM